MTADETLAFRSLVHKECLNHKIRLFDFGQEAKQRVGIPPDLVVPPFAVVASNQFDEVRCPSLPPSLPPSRLPSRSVLLP